MANGTGISLYPGISSNTHISGSVLGISKGPGISANDPTATTASHILTEAGDIITTEAGDRLITET